MPPPTRKLHQQRRVATRNFNDAYEKLLDGMCPIHKDNKHTMRQCYGMAKTFHDEE